MRSALIRYVALAGLFTGWQANASAAVEQFVLPNHGTLVLNVPSSWKADVKTPAGNSPQIILIAPRSGAAFRMLLTPIWGDETRVLPDDAKIRSVVESAAKGAEAGAVNPIAVHDIDGPSSHGYYFSATDKAPAAGDWKYMRQGTIKTGDIVLTFTIVAKDGQQANAKTALDMIRRASQQFPNSVMASSRN